MKHIVKIWEEQSSHGHWVLEARALEAGDPRRDYAVACPVCDVDVTQ